MRVVAILLTLLAGMAISAEAQGNYTISYVGRTFGYYRIPSIQKASQGHCDASVVDLPAVKKIIQEIQAGGARDALVSVGDNFAPELGARSIEKDGRLQPKDLLSFDYLNTHTWVDYDRKPPELLHSLAQGEGVIDFDNVGCFFKLAGFDAMVPGKHDFHFGAERLQEIARYLADPSSGKAVHMLGANMTLATTLVNPPAQTRPAPKPDNYAYAGTKGAQFSLPTVPLPYMRVFAIQKGVDVQGYVESSGGEYHLQKLTQGGLAEGVANSAIKLYSHAWICRGELGAHFDAQGCQSLTGAGTDGTTLRFKLPLDVFGLYPSATALQPGVNYYVCASSVENGSAMTDKNTLCHATFQFHYPFFQWGHASQPNPKPYVIAGSIAIFGVVDLDLSTQIGALNDSWLNGNSLFQTQLQIVDPHNALLQLNETCQEDPACAGKRRILLAQMPAQRAQQLAAHFDSKEGFDLVISQAEDSDATGEVSVTHYGAKVKVQVVTPQTTVISDQPDKLRVALSTATVHIAQEERTLRNHLSVSEADLMRQPYTGKRPLWQLMVQAGLVPAPAEKSSIDGKTIVQNGILSVMRQYCKADVAMLQDRDLYRPEHFAVEQPAADQLQDLLDRLLWKGDFISCRPVPGSALKQAESLSQQFASEAKNEFAAAGEMGRSLEVLGMFSDPAAGLIADGAVVQDAQLYSIATTDFLSYGETGYEVLASMHGGHSPDALQASDFTAITTLVCRALIGAIPDGDSAGAYCRAPIDAEAYIDPIEQNPYAIPKGISGGGKLREWASENWATRNALQPIKDNPAEFNAQNRRVFTIELDRADLGFQRNQHSLNEAEQQQRFAGVQAAQPTAPERYDWTADYLVRMTSSGKNVDRFVQADAEYEDTGVMEVFSTPNGSTETYQLSRPQNSAGIEAGIETRLFPSHQKNPTGIRLLTSFRYQTEVNHPFVQFQAADGYLNESLPRGNALLGKVGLRYEGEKSWLELGMQTGPQTQVQTFSLGSLVCDPGNVQGCVSTTSTLPLVQQLSGLPFHVDTARRDESGVFFNGRIHLPLLYRHLDYVIENQGSLYFNRAGDSPSETRYLEDMKHSLVIPVIGDLAIVPTVDIFLFQNKVNGWHIHGYQTAVTAQYRFDWHNGLRWKDALRYPSPPSTH